MFRYFKFLKGTLEVVALTAACVAFGNYLLDADARKTAGKLQSLQLSQLCQSLASTVDGTNVWNYQAPKTFDDWDKENEALDTRIEFLNNTCSDVPNFVPATRVIKSSSSNNETHPQK